MNHFERCMRDCQIGVKAFQNIRASLLAFQRICGLISSDDSILLEGLFHAGVIRYAKPFVKSRGEVSHPVKDLLNVEGHSKNLHDHLMTIRDTLIAHDDFTKIKPRILFYGASVKGANIAVPTSIVVANKCLGYPSDLEGAQSIRTHVDATLRGVVNSLGKNISRLRDLVIKNPEELLNKSDYSRHMGTVSLKEGVGQLPSADIMNDSWLDTLEPTFLEILNGYRYEEIKMRCDFHGPEEIDLPGGKKIVITPP